MLTDRELKVLLIILERKSALILFPKKEKAQEMRSYLRERIKANYPLLYNNYITNGNTVYIKGHEPVTVMTPEEWRSENKTLFRGIVLTDDMTSDDYSPLPMILSAPEKLHEYLRGIRI